MAFGSNPRREDDNRSTHSRASSATTIDVGDSRDPFSDKYDIEMDNIDKAKKQATPKNGTEELDAMSRLPVTEQAVLKEQIDTPEHTYGLGAVYRYATPTDFTIIAVCILCSIVTGAAMPMMTIIFGGLQRTFQEYMLLKTIDKAEFERTLTSYLLYFVYLAIGTFCASYITTVGFIYTGEHISGQIRAHYLEACLRQNIGYFDKLGAGEVTTKITADAATIQDGISEKVGMFFQAISTFLAGYVIGFTKSWQLTLILGSSLFAIIIVSGLCTKFLVKYSLPMIASFSKASGVADEVMSSIRVAVAFGTQEKLVKQYDDELAVSQKWGFKVKVVMAWMLGIAMAILYWNYGLGFWQGARFLVDGNLQLNDVTSCLMSVMTGTFQMGSIGPQFQSFTQAITTASKMFNTIDRKSPLDVTSEQGTKIHNLKGHISLENVKFIYPSRPEVTVMDGVSLEIPAGKVTALVGPSGSGKSTIVGLVERFYNPVQGRVYLDGHDISSTNLRWLRQQIALVGQEPTLFACSILDNVRHGLIGTDYENVDLEKQRELVIDAAKQANAHDFISQLPDGYDTNVGQRGFLLSGGQKQRIAIARAIVSNPKILLLDEATSALDTKSEGVVQAALENASEGRTTITIAHRLSTIRDAHNIVVMSAGRIVEQGNHKQLLALRGTYYDLVQAQEVEDENKKTAEALMEPLDEEEEMLIRRMSQFKNVGGFYTNPNHAENRRQSYFNRKSMAPNRRSVASMYIDSKAELTAEEPTYSLGTLIKFVASFNKTEWWLMLIGLIASIICGGANPTQAVFFAKQITTLGPIEAVDHAHQLQVQKDSNFWSSMYLMLGFVQMAAYVVQGVTLGVCAEALSRRLRHQTFASILRQDISFFDEEKHNVGALNAFLAVETSQVAGLSGVTLGTIMISVTNVFSGLAISLALGWELALVCFSVVPVVIACGFFRSWMLVHFQKRAADAYALSAAFAAENIAAMKTVAALTREKQVNEKYLADLTLQGKQSLRSVAKSSTLFAASQSVMYFAYALAFWYGGKKMASGAYDMFQFFVCFMSIIFGAQSAGTFFASAPDMAKAKASAANLKKLLERKPAIDTWEAEGAPVKSMEGHVEFRNVHFRYPTRPKQPVLRGLNLKIEPGTYVALVGASGCGKSTTISLMERFYDPLVGEVLVDGRDISKLNVNEFRSHMALVSQEPTLYQGSIRDNIILGAEDGVTDAQIEEACREANIYDFIVSLPEGFNTSVGAKGGMLSGGQKQRIAIARALIRKPRILLLDEATSALDSESEHIVQKALDRAAKGRTTITIAHRLSTVQHADAIHVFDQGRVVESGTHSELMAMEGRYWELVRLQSLGSA